jgi:agmatinase
MNRLHSSAEFNNFDPNGVGRKGSLFGLPFSVEEAQVVVIPIPWDVTASFREGASRGPRAILNASTQIDLFVPDIRDAWKLGIAMLPVEDSWLLTNDKARKEASGYIARLEASEDHPQREVNDIAEQINALSKKLNDWVYEKSIQILKAGKIPVALGGDHSVPFGLLKAFNDITQPFAVLQIDAHADLRPCYQGFEHSHASIMHNVLTLDHVQKLGQVGIRDICEQEAKRIQEDDQIVTFYDSEMKKARFEGTTWSSQVNSIVAELPDLVYLSVDIDGVEAQYCPGTGTPVPGGLSYDQALFLVDTVATSGKKIIGFDICEVSSGQWDAIVGSHMLYHLANMTAISQQLLFKKH